jgi:hypothetical protein
MGFMSMGLVMVPTLNTAQCLRTEQQPTHRTRVVEFMKAPFTGVWLGEAGYLSVRQIAEGTGLDRISVRRVLNTAPATFESTPRGNKKLWRLVQQGGTK